MPFMQMPYDMLNLHPSGYAARCRRTWLCFDQQHEGQLFCTILSALTCLGASIVRQLCCVLSCAELSAAFASLAPVRVLWHINTQVRPWVFGTCKP